MFIYRSPILDKTNTQSHRSKLLNRQPSAIIDISPAPPKDGSCLHQQVLQRLPRLPQIRTLILPEGQGRNDRPDTILPFRLNLDSPAQGRRDDLKRRSNYGTKVEPGAMMAMSQAAHFDRADVDFHRSQDQRLKDDVLAQLHGLSLIAVDGVVQERLVEPGFYLQEPVISRPAQLSCRIAGCLLLVAHGRRQIGGPDEYLLFKLFCARD